MAARGVNGAGAATLNARFIKCAGCRVNVPKEDMLALGKCTVCGHAYEPEVVDEGRAVQVETVAFDGSAAAESKPRRKRWAVLTSKKGRTYYHNTETGEDTWEKPRDLDADAADDAFVPFKNDAIKNAVLREQAKTEATKMGVPMEVIALAQRREQEEELANDPIAQLGRNKAEQAPAAAAPAAKSSPKLPSPRAEQSGSSDSDEQADESGGDDEKNRTCVLM